MADSTRTQALDQSYLWRGKTYGPGEAVSVPSDFPAAPGARPSREAPEDRAGTSGSGKPLGADAATGAVDYASLTKAELEEQAAARGLAVEGSGADGNVLKADLVDALTAADGAR